MGGEKSLKRGEPAPLAEGCGPGAGPRCSGGACRNDVGEMCRDGAGASRSSPLPARAAPASEAIALLRSKADRGAERCAHPAGVWLCNGTAGSM